MTAALGRDVEELVEAVVLLSADVKAAADLSKVLGDTQFARRTFVRAVFALVEGNMNLMASVCLQSADRGEVQMSVNEREVLSQERNVQRKSMGTTIPKFKPAKDRLGPLMNIFARLYGRTYALNKSNAGWRSFATSVELRNRITHPRNASAFKVNDAELRTLEHAKAWFADSMEDLLNTCFATRH